MSKNILQLISLLLSVIFLTSYSDATLDKTLVERSIGHDVVCAVIEKISDSGIFPDDKGILRRIAYVESQFGNDEKTFRGTYYGGIWQVDETTLKDMIDASYNNLKTEIWPRIKEMFGIDRSKITYRDLMKPLYSGLIARMKLDTITQMIPENYDTEMQAKYWKNFYNSTSLQLGEGDHVKFMQRVAEMEIEHGQFCDNCQGRLNLAILMDASGSIMPDDYVLAKKAAENLLDTFSNETVDVSYIVFSSDSTIIFPLKSYLTKEQMKQKIARTPHPAIGTSTHLAIIDGVEILNHATNNTGIPKVMVIFTDGQPNNEQATRDSVKLAELANITIFAIGIGSEIEQDNLLEMAKTPSRVLSISSYHALSHSFKQINSQTCRVPQKPDLGERVDNDLLNKHEKRYFQLPLTGEGITVKTNTSQGDIQGYYSYIVENPNSAINDGEFEREVFIPVKRSEPECYKGDRNETNSVFVTIEGKQNKNEYSLETLEGNQMNVGRTLQISMTIMLWCLVVLII